MATPPFLPDESKPADSDIVSQYPAVERAFRDIIESWFLIDHDTAGEHVQVTLPESVGDPSNVSNTGFVYTKDDGGGATELFYEDDSGNVVQITAGGGPGPDMATFPAGTKMLFVQTAAPTGWTKDTDQDDKALRVVSGTPGTGGATAFTTVFGSGKAAGAHQLTIAETPAHTHEYLFTNTSVAGTGSNETKVGTGFASSSVGGDGTHTHTLSLDLQYMDVIKATKD